jgi:hypothetical protein
MTSHRDEQTAGAPSRRRILRAGLAAAGGLALAGPRGRSARAAQSPGTTCIIWEIGEIEAYDMSLWFYYGQDCQEPYDTVAYYAASRLDPAFFGCGGPYCYPAPQYTFPSTATTTSDEATATTTQALAAPSTSPTRRVRFLDERLKQRGLTQPLPANRGFRPSVLGRVRVLEQGNYRVPLLKRPVHLALVLVTPPDDPKTGRQRHPLLTGIGVSSNDVTAPPVRADVFRPRADEQYVLVYRASDDVYFHVITCKE